MSTLMGFDFFHSRAYSILDVVCIMALCLVYICCLFFWGILLYLKLRVFIIVPLQAEEAQRLRKRKKAESKRLLDMQKRQKERIEEVRETQKKVAFMSLIDTNRFLC